MRPRKPRRTFSPIIVYTPDVIYTEFHDVYREPDDIFALVATEQPSLIVATGIASLLYRLHERFHTHPDWQFSCSPVEHQRWSANRVETAIRSRDTAVTFLGFKGKRLDDGPRGGKRHEPNRYHTTLDPVTFAKRSIDEILPGESHTVERLYVWATEVRRFCYDQGLTLRPTSGALSSQLLRDKRFYPHARRKVPRATNDKVRDQLPGNFYRLLEDEEKPVDAYYLDQTSAHHTCARDLTFPHANQLKAVGRFQTLEDKRGVGTRALAGYGLFYAKLTVPHMPPGKFPPPWASVPGECTAYLYSNELALARQLGVHIQYIIAAWISNCRDFGLNRYARWSLSQLTQQPKWIKPVLLSTYGVLAATPRVHRVGYAQAKAGTPALYPAAADYIPVIERASTKPQEPAYANVIHRGMIEAETRLRSLQLARELFSRGHRVIAVYADSVFLHARNANDENLPLPLPPPGWEVQAVLTRLRFHNSVSFSSDQLTKLPGIPSRDVVLRASFGTRKTPAKPRENVLNSVA